MRAQVNFHARVAANVLRIVERELTDDSAAEVTGRLAELGFADEAQLAAAIRAGHWTTARPTCCRPCARWSAIGWRSLIRAMTSPSGLV